MFGFFSSQDRKMRANAANWIELATRVWHYRRDQLSEAEEKELRARTEELRIESNAKADAAKLKLGIERLDTTLRRVGGRIYPKSALVENVEFFLVAAIVILGIRAYIVQPFKIPTNSMAPSFYGMTAETFPRPEDRPKPWMSAVRFVLFGAQRVEAIAPASGEVSAEFALNTRSLAYSEVRGRRWFVFPATYHEYTFYVEGQPVKFRVPEDFRGVEEILERTVGRSRAELFDDAVLAQGEPTLIRYRTGTERAIRARIGASVKQGDPIISFDILTGDQLFVDRVSYHFIRPSVGDGFVFRTDHIDHPDMKTATGGQLQQYYIKRLVGLPGDTLEIRSPVLYRNSAPISGARAFERNAAREGRFPGYQNVGRLSRGMQMKVPPDYFLALGDNSANSLDGRYWGFVQAKDVIGRPLFVYYPFTARWGPPR